MAGIFYGVRARLRRAARSAAFVIAGIIFGLVGLGFLTVALWILLATHESALVANVVIGALYIVLAFSFLALGAQPGHPQPHHDEPPERYPPERDPLVRIAEGFAVGFDAGCSARKSRR